MPVTVVKLGKVVITHKGDWVGGGTYNVLDVVNYTDSSYICIVDAPAGIDISSTTYWKFLAKGTYQLWLAQGNTGTVQDFFDSFKGVKGDDGKSAWQAAVEAGYTRSEQQFGEDLVSIQNRESVSNKKDTVTNSTTDYPNGKAVYDGLALKREKSILIEREDTAFFEKGKNIFNKADVVLSSFVNTTTGNLNGSASYWASDYIPVEPETQYCVSFVNRIAWYNLNKMFISGEMPAGTVLTSPANAKYMRFSVEASINKDTFQIEQGDTPTAYEQYYNVIKEDAISKYIDGVYREKAVKLIADDLEILGRNKNLFIQETITAGAYVNWNNGGLVNNASYNASDYIPVEPETDYYNSDGSHYAIYDSNKAFITGKSGSYDNLILTPANAAFIRISVLNETAQFEKGTKRTSYVKGGYIFKSPIISHPLTEIVMPPKYIAVVGTPLQIFYQGLIKTTNPRKYNLVVNCLRGKDFLRYWEFTPQVADIGTYTLSITLYDDESVFINRASTVIEVVQFVKSPTTKKNILTLGDSLNDGEGDWGDALAKQIVDGTNILPGLSPISNVDFIGELGDAPKQFTGHGGWSWVDYTSEPNPAIADIWVYATHDKTISDQESLWKDTGDNIWQLETIEVSRLKFKRYGHSANMPAAPASLVHNMNAVNTATINYTSIQIAEQNPFWDTETSKVDFVNWFSNKYPAKQAAGEVIDACFVLFGWNGGAYNKVTDTDWADYIATAKTFIDNLHADYPNCKVYVMGIQYPSLNGGLGNNYGAVGGYLSGLWSVIMSVQSLNVAYKNLCSEPAYSSFCQFINISGQFDSEYNMPYTMTPVNLRSSITERLGINGVHPSADGYLQIADAALRVFIEDFCQ